MEKLYFVNDDNSIRLCPINKKFNAHLSGFFNMYDRDKQREIFAYIKKVIYNEPATIVIWNDGSKTMTKCCPGDIYSREAGLAICILKKLLGGAAVYDILEDWAPMYDTIVDVKDVRAKHKEK